MGNINTLRWVVGGAVAGGIIFVVNFVLNGVILADQWDQAMSAMGLPAVADSAGQIIAFLVFDLVIGLSAMWIYVGIRPRFGAGVTTAVNAGLVTWLLAFALPNAFMLTVGLFPAALLWTTAFVGIVQVVVATIAGAYVYQETA